MDPLKWVIENKAWLFSGIGVAIIAAIIAIVRWMLRTHIRPWVTIDHYEETYVEDDETGEESLVEKLHIVNRGGAPAVSIAIQPIQRLGRTARLLEPQLSTLGSGDSTNARILNLKHVLEGVNQKVPKIMGRPWSVRIPLTVEYYDLNHVRWTTDHAITFNARGISIDIVRPNEPQEWTDVSSSKDKTKCIILSNVYAVGTPPLRSQAGLHLTAKSKH